MTGRVTATVLTDEDEDATPGLVRLPSPGSLAVDTGDVVSLRSAGGAQTVARVQPDATLDPGTIRLPPDVAGSLGVGDGDAVVIEPTTATPAARIVVAPVAQLSVRGGEDAVREALADRPVVVGDRLTVSLLGGTFDVPFRVTETVPSGTVTFGPDTDLELASGPAPPATGRRRTTPVPSAGVGGYDSTVEACQSAIVGPVRAADAYRLDGRSVAAGVLVEGQAGVGKTHHVRHAAWLANATILRVDCAALADTPGSRVDDRLDDLVREAATAGAVVVHLDDLDAMATDDEPGPTVRRLGAWIEELSGHEDTVVVGETRDTDDLDAALTRGGRLSRTVSVPNPTTEDRAAVLRVLFGGLDLDADVDVGRVADRTLGYVAADLVSLRARAIEAALVRSSSATPTITAPDLETALSETTPSAATPVGSVPSITFDDIGGLADVKRELTRAVEWPLRYPDALSRLGVDAPAGILLYGPPGTGKTMLARAVASTTDANFLTVNGPELLNKYVGESERRVRELFERARDSAPAVVFFDELDALGSARGDDGDSSAPERVVSQLLTELDGLQPREQVTVVGATNRPDRIDEALIRPGRFDRLVEVPLPDADARRAIVRIHLRDRPVEDVDVDQLARLTDGYSGSDIAAVLQEASLLALEERLDAAGDATGGIDPGATPTAATNGSDPSVADGLVVTRRHVARALDRIGPSLSQTARERYAAFGNDDGDSGGGGGGGPRRSGE
jgi:transitional endoplasmic reticulum ATPase